MLRSHYPVTISNFGGLYQRGDKDNCPIDHFQDGQNFKFIGDAVTTRDGIAISQAVKVPLSDVKRIYNYPTQTGNTLIALVKNSLGIGEIYHVVNSTLVYGPLLSISGMTDFAFVPYAGRAYISPFSTFQITGLDNSPLNIEKGLQNEFLYVYAGDGTAARKAAGSPLAGAITIANGAAGHTDAGLHIFAFVGETLSGYLTAPGSNKSFVTLPGNSVSFGSVPTSGTGAFSKRHLVATKVIPSFDGNLNGYQFFFVPNATINDDSTTALNNISFYDADLLDDATHLINNYSSIPAVASLSFYHNRLVAAASFTDISLALLSASGEPEAIDQINGLIVVPLDGNPITNAQELRDVLYIFKRARTVSYVDNGDEPSTWSLVIVDNALGTSVHGIATVLDSGSSSVDYLQVCTFQGATLFNGQYVIPELSWKIEDLWKNLDRNQFGKIQIINSPIQKEIYVVTPDDRLLVGNYSKGMSSKTIRWSQWAFSSGINTIAIANIDDLIIGADL